MRKLMLTVAAVAAGALSLNGATAEQNQTEQQAQQDGMKVTGMVTEVDKRSNEITVDGETFILSDTGGGASVMPQVGAEVTLFYRDEGGQKLITRIGQAQK